METGLLHLHRTLGYVIFLAALVNVVLVLTKARTDARAAGAAYLLDYAEAITGRPRPVPGPAERIVDQMVDKIVDKTRTAGQAEIQ